MGPYRVNSHRKCIISGIFKGGKKLKDISVVMQKVETIKETD